MSLDKMKTMFFSKLQPSLRLERKSLGRTETKFPVNHSPVSDLRENVIKQNRNCFICNRSERLTTDRIETTFLCEVQFILKPVRTKLDRRERKFGVKSNPVSDLREYL